MATARKLPSGSWRVRIFDHTENGKKIYKSFTADTKKDAELQAAQYATSKKMSISTNIFSYELEKYISERESVLSPSTIRGYRQIQKILNTEYKWFMAKKVSSITKNDVQSIINNISKKRTPKTVRNYFGLISTVLKKYIVLDTTLPQKIIPDLYIPTDEDIKKLLDVVSGTELEIPIMLGAFCMMRRGEICGLSIDDIDENIIHIHHSLVLGSDRKWHLKAPKTTNSDRYVEAPDFVIEKIMKVGHITNYSPQTISWMFEDVLEQNNIPKFRFHDLRHYSASVRHALGIPDAYIMEAGGWSSDRVLKSVYRHTMSDRKKEMSDKANSHFNEMYDTKDDTNKINP